MPAVSAITIFYEAERFLAEAIESVIAQTFTDWELILVDDGSTDGGPAIAARYAAEHPQIRLVTHPAGENRGMSASRNLGAAASSGEFIAFIDADDLWEPNKLEEQVTLARAHPEVGMLYGRTLWWYGWTGRPEDAARDYEHDPGVPLDVVIEPPTLVPGLVAAGLVPPYTCSVLVRREAYERLGGFEEAFPGLYEDQVFFAKVLLEERIYVADRCWDRYRQHDASACAVAFAALETMPADINPFRGAFLEWLYRHVAHGHAAQSELLEVVAEALAPYRHPTAPWEITAVAQAEAGDDLLGSYIDMPATGTPTGGAVVEILGWALGRTAPVIAVELLENGRILKRAPVGERRPDLAGAFPDVVDAENAGYRLALVPSGAATFTVELRAVLRDQRRVSLGRIDGRRRLRPEDRATGAALVSLVLLAGGDATGVAEAVDRLLDQTYGYTEVLVVDAGMTDEERRTLARFAGLRIVVANGNAAEESGLAASSGTFVAFVTAEQHLAPGAVSLAVSRLREDPDLRWASTGNDPAALDGDGAAVFHRYAAVRRERTDSTPPVVSRSSAVVVLLYHRVAEADIDPWALCVAPDRFAEQLEVIRQVATPLSVGELVVALEDFRLPERAVVVTFDDGYADNLTTALPLLERAGVPATFFVAAGAVDSPAEFWWDELERVVLGKHALPETLELQVEEELRRWSLDGSAGETAGERGWRAWEAPPTSRHGLYADLYRLLRPLAYHEREDVLRQLRTACGVDGPARDSHRGLSATEIGELNRSDAVEIGAHTVSHPRLADLSFEEERFEVEESKRRLEEILRIPVTGFAYPYGSRGDYSERSRATVAGAGFSYAFAAHGCLISPASRRFELPRIAVGDVGGDEFASELQILFSR